MTRPCLPCSGTGATGSGPCSDGFRHVHPCDACHGAGEVPVRCPCGQPAVHELPVLGALCASCAPHGCGTCATWGRVCCMKHSHIAMSLRAANQGYAPELKVLCGEHPAFMDPTVPDLDPTVPACFARTVADDDLAYVCQLADGHRGVHRHRALIWGHGDLVWTRAS